MPVQTVLGMERLLFRFITARDRKTKRRKTHADCFCLRKFESIQRFRLLTPEVVFLQAMRHSSLNENGRTGGYLRCRTSPESSEKTARFLDIFKPLMLGPEDLFP
jgi:hypothetical protein